MKRDDTWTTHTHLIGQNGNRIGTGTRVWIPQGAAGSDGPRHARTRGGVFLHVSPTTAGPTDRGELSAVEHRALLGAVKPGEPFR